jgi:hypothetical protein
MKRDIEKRVGQALKLFWNTRDRQSENQGLKTGQKDAVTPSRFQYQVE